MTREQIERASVTMKESQNYHMSFEDAQDYISKCGFDIPWNDGDVFVDEREITRTVGNVLKWRINSVWHEPSAYGDELKKEVEVIAKTKRGYRFGKFDVVGYSNEYIGFVSTSSLEYALSDVLEYAYLSDLLPDRKEVRNDTEGYHVPSVL